jgi:uncharacterized membrane protein (Fun14 family)
MRPFEERPLDPELLAELDAIDATLAGEPVDPAHAEIAELALLLTATRERPSQEFTRTLDARVARRFVAAPVAGTPRQRARAGFLSWLTRPAFASALAGGFAVVAVAAVIASGALSSGGSHSVVNGPVEYGTHTAPVTNATTTAGGSTGSPVVTSTKRSSAGSSGAGAVGATNLTQSVAAIPTPASTNGGRVIQSAQLQLTTLNTHIDEVAQEVFNVVSLESGTVQHSQVTQAANGNDGGSYATFTLRIPTSNLQQAMTRMSALHYATVSSRTDGTQNVSGQYQADQRQIADQKAVRSALLRKLQTAYTQSAIDSLQAQLKLAGRQLSSDEAALQSLRHQISYSSLQVQINAGPIVYPLVTANHGFTVGRAAHDSVRVLVVAAGVALIALAVMVPLGVVTALIAWIAVWVRRRRRQQTLDTA